MTPFQVVLTLIWLLYGTYLVFWSPQIAEHPRARVPRAAYVGLGLVFYSLAIAMLLST